MWRLRVSRWRILDTKERDIRHPSYGDQIFTYCWRYRQWQCFDDAAAAKAE